MTKETRSELMTKKSAANTLRLFRGLNDCKHYLLQPCQATFYTYTKGTK
jgi:hypothetical protein